MASKLPVRKVVLTGPAQAGKSSLIQRLADGKFTRQYIPTIGVDFRFVNQQGTQLQIWDTAGQARFQTITSAYYRGADAMVIVVDVEDADIVKHIQEHAETIRRYSKAPLFVMLNKADTRTKLPDLQELMDKLKCKVFTVSAKIGKNVEESFQDITNQITSTKPSPTEEESEKKSDVIKASELPLFKVVLTGPAQSGKSNLMQRLAHDKFTYEYLPTIGVDFRFVDLQGAKLQIWDTSGQAQFQTINSAYSRGADAVVIVVDVEDINIVKHIGEHVEMIRRYSNAPLFVMLNKADNLTKRILPVQDFFKLTDRLHFKVFQVSAESGKNVKESFQAITNQLNNTIRIKEPIEEEEEEKCSLSDTANRFTEKLLALKQTMKERQEHLEDLENLPTLLVKAVHKLTGLEARPPMLNRKSAQNAQFDALVQSAMKRIHEACLDVDKLPSYVQIKVSETMLEAFRQVFEEEHQYTVIDMDKGYTSIHTPSSKTKPDFHTVRISWD